MNIFSKINQARQKAINKKEEAEQRKLDIARAQTKILEKKKERSALIDKQQKLKKELSPLRKPIKEISETAKYITQERKKDSPLNEIKKNITPFSQSATHYDGPFSIPHNDSPNNYYGRTLKKRISPFNFR